MTTGRAPVVIRPLAAPFTGTGSPVQTQGNIVNPTGFITFHLIPIWPDLPHQVATAFALNLLGVCNYFLCHCSSVLNLPLLRTGATLNSLFTHQFLDYYYTINKVTGQGFEK
jgi:hypothetical protein